MQSVNVHLGIACHRRLRLFFVETKQYKSADNYASDSQGIGSPIPCTLKTANM